MAASNRPKPTGGGGRKKLVKTPFQLQKEDSLWKHVQFGRPKMYETVYDLWIAACEYFNWSDENPLLAAEWKDGELIQVPKRRPYTMMGLQLFLNVGRDYLGQFGTQKEDLDKDGNSYSVLVAKLKDICYKQKFEGAASGFFNANLISRDLGLADKQQIQSNINLSDTPIEFE